MRKITFLIVVLFAAVLYGQAYGEIYETLPILKVCFPRPNYYFFSANQFLIDEDSGDTLDCLDISKISFADFNENVSGFYTESYAGGSDYHSPSVLFKQDEDNNPHSINVFIDTYWGHTGPYGSIDHHFEKNAEGYLEVIEDEEENDEYLTSKKFVYKDGKFVEETKEK